MAVFQNFPPPFQAAIGAHRIGHIHKAVQVHESGEKIGGGADHGGAEQTGQRQPEDKQTDAPPQKADFQPNHRQTAEHFVPGLFLPPVPGEGQGAEHTLAHPQGV